MGDKLSSSTLCPEFPERFDFLGKPGLFVYVSTFRRHDELMGGREGGCAGGRCGGWSKGGEGGVVTPPAHHSSGGAGAGGSRKRCGPPLGCPLMQACIIDGRGWAGVGH